MRKYSIFSKKKNVKDEITYLIPLQVIHDTETVLSQYAKIRPSNEGLVYWSGIISKTKINVTTIIAPKTKSDFGSVSTSAYSNFEFVKALNKKHIVQIAQVHSHPGNLTEHSLGDDKMAAFKVNGLVSIVVPYYGKKGMLPLSKCGIHRYDEGIFERLSDNYIKNHFKIEPDSTSEFMDLRN